MFMFAFSFLATQRGELRNALRKVHKEYQQVNEDALRAEEEYLALSASNTS
jgi:uncharacterized membrane protein